MPVRKRRFFALVFCIQGILCYNTCSNPADRPREITAEGVVQRMKIVLLADLHGNMVATEAMERELEKIRPDDIWFLGDAVGKGPESDRTCDWARTHCGHWIAGNWDRSMSMYPEYNAFYRQQLGKERIDWLDSLPLEDELRHTRDYLRCMDIRYQGDLVYAIDVPEALNRATAARVEENFLAIAARCQAEEPLPPLSSPVGTFSYARTGASVGEKINPFYKVGMKHGGLDLIAQRGDPVYAAADGVVSEVVHATKGLGNVVEIRHAGGYLTRYAHLENTRVYRGQRVRSGAQVGQVGMSGKSFAPHLHYEVLRDSVLLDPVHFFFGSVKPEEYMGMIFMSANAGQSMD